MKFFREKAYFETWPKRFGVEFNPLKKVLVRVGFFSFPWINSTSMSEAIKRAGFWNWIFQYRRWGYTKSIVWQIRFMWFSIAILKETI